MKLKKRKKSSRHRGTHTHGRGFKKKARGSGHRGGVGMAGSGKRADQKKTLILKKFGTKYFGKSKALRVGKPTKEIKTINLANIEQNLFSLVKKDAAKSVKGAYEINLKDYKILSNGEIRTKLIINAKSASKSAIDKVKKLGGDIIIK